MSIRPVHSARAVPTKRSAIAFIQHGRPSSQVKRICAEAGVGDGCAEIMDELFSGT